MISGVLAELRQASTCCGASDKTFLVFYCAFDINSSFLGNSHGVAYRNLKIETESPVFNN